MRKDFQRPGQASAAADPQIVAALERFRAVRRLGLSAAAVEDTFRRVKWPRVSDIAAAFSRIGDLVLPCSPTAEISPAEREIAAAIHRCTVNIRKLALLLEQRGLRRKVWPNRRVRKALLAGDVDRAERLCLDHYRRYLDWLVAEHEAAKQKLSWDEATPHWTAGDPPSPPPPPRLWRSGRLRRTKEEVSA